MEGDETLAYLGGLMDGDGYFKIVKSHLQGGRWTYYQIQLGVQQLWPGKAVQLFARTFDGKMMKPVVRPGLRPMARCEIHTRKAEAALHRLLPYLLVKRRQAILLQRLCRLKAQPKPISVAQNPGTLNGGETAPRRRRFSAVRVAEMELLRSRLIALHEGSSPDPTGGTVDIESQANEHPKWTRAETLAYLAGTMDSDGSFRIEKRNVKKMLAPHYRVNIRAAQVVPSAAIELLARTFGGHVTTRTSIRLGCRDLASWSLHDKSAAESVAALLPYLVVKRPQAELLLELRRLKGQGKQGLTEWVHRNRWPRPIRMRKRCYTSEQVAEFERIRREVNALHSGNHGNVHP